MLAAQWGLPLPEISELGDRFYDFRERFRPLMQTKTHDTSRYGVEYVSGVLRLPPKRTMTEISRQSGIASQNMPQFISDSPWAGMRLIEAVQGEVKAHPAFGEAVAVLDESAEAKAGSASVGAGRQHNGRLGKVDQSQVGVFLAWVRPQVNLWLDGELFVPEGWFEPGQAGRRQRVGLPAERTFQTKPELAWTLIERAQSSG
jgi:SRSO17 transposase